MFGKREKSRSTCYIRGSLTIIDVSVVGVMKLVIADFLVTYLYHREGE